MLLRLVKGELGRNDDRRKRAVGGLASHKAKQCKQSNVCWLAKRIERDEWQSRLTVK